VAEFADQTLSGEVALDGNTFTNVDFANAILTYDGGVPPSFANCRFNTARFTFRDSASNTLMFLRAMVPAETNMRPIVFGLMPELQA
jgi:hypothetical protein